MGKFTHRALCANDQLAAKKCGELYAHVQRVLAELSKIERKSNRLRIGYFEGDVAWDLSKARSHLHSLRVRFLLERRKYLGEVFESEVL